MWHQSPSETLVSAQSQRSFACNDGTLPAVLTALPLGCWGNAAVQATHTKQRLLACIQEAVAASRGKRVTGKMRAEFSNLPVSRSRAAGGYCTVAPSHSKPNMAAIEICILLTPCRMPREEASGNKEVSQRCRLSSLQMGMKDSASSKQKPMF